MGGVILECRCSFFDSHASSLHVIRSTAHSGIRPADIADIRDAEINTRWNEFTEAALPAEHQVNRLPFVALDLDNFPPTLVKERVIGYFNQLWSEYSRREFSSALTKNHRSNSWRTLCVALE